MSSPNFKTFLMAVRTLDALRRADAERAFTDRYHRAVAASGHEYAEGLAASETLHILLTADLDFDGAAYLKSHLR
ncbi:MAG: hypothetical protein WC807_20175 [Hyphomicrobium sp.]|jgi:hypothetical protein